MSIATAQVSVQSADWYEGSHRRRLTVATSTTVLVSLGFAGLVLAVHFVSAVALLTVVVLAAIVWRPRVGLYVVFGMVCAFETLSQDELMLPGVYFNGDISNMLHIPGVIFSPVELLLLLSFIVWLAQGLIRHQIDFRSGDVLWRPMLFFAFALVFGVVRGLASGGLFNMALWESRFLFYMVLCYVIASNTIRTPAHVRRLMALFLIGTTLFAIEGAYRRVALIDTGKLGVVTEAWYSHEDVVFLGSGILLVLARWVFGGPRWMAWLGAFLIGVMGFTLLVSERRAGYIAVMVAFLAFIPIFWRVKRKAFFLVAVPMLLVGAIYLPAFWNASGPLAQPARAVRSLKDPDPRDASSNLYRELEKINIRATIAANPVLGVGFGRPYNIVTPLPDISWFPFWNYETHADILWLWLKMGPVGFAMFFVVMGTALARAGTLLRTLKKPEALTFTMLTVAGIVAALVFCYVDLGLTSGRLPVLLGTLMGTMSVLHRVYE